MKYLYVLIMFLTLSLKALAQEKTPPILEREITLSITNESVQYALSAISQQANVIFSYNPNLVKATANITLDVKKKSVRHVLNLLFKGTIDYKVKGKYIILQKKAVDTESTKKKEQLVEGYVYDSKTGQKLTEASIYDKNLLLSAITDQYGYFKLELPPDHHKSPLFISKQGYTDTIVTTLRDSAAYVNVELSLKMSDSVSQAQEVLSDSGSNKYPKMLRWLLSRKIKINTLNLPDTIFKEVQISVLPFVSTNRLLTGSVVNNFSLNLTAGYVQGVRTLEMGGMFNIDRYDVGVCQLAGLGNIVGGNSRGLQAAGIVNAARSVNGLQMAGILNAVLKDAQKCQMAGIGNVVGGAFKGLQMAGIFNAARSIEGIQMAGIVNTVLKDAKKCQMAGIGNVTGGTSKGLQAAGIFNAAQSLEGVQVSGIINSVLKNAHTCQIAGIGNVVGGTSTGLQVSGIFNYATKVSGTQVAGICNATLFLKGTQFAFVNFADSCEGTPIGLFSYVVHGYHKLEVSADEIFYTNFAFRTGVKRFHTIFLAGIQPTSLNNSLYTYGLGLGTSFGKSDKLFFDADISSQQIMRGDVFTFDNRLHKIYFGLDRRITSKVSLAIGVSYNLLISKIDNTNYEKDYANIAPYTLLNTSSANNNLKTWVGGKIAVRFF